MATIRHAVTVLSRLEGGDVLIQERSGRCHIQQCTVLPRVVQELVRDRKLTWTLDHSTGTLTYRLRPTTAAPSAGPEKRNGASKTGDPITSRLAGSHVDLVGSQRYVWNLFRIYGPMTTVQLQQVHEENVRRGDPVPRISPSRLRSACPELERSRYLERAGTSPTGHTTSTGVQTHATVWQVTQRAHEAQRPEAATLNASPLPPLL